MHIKVEERGSGAVAVNANSVKNVEETIQTGREITCSMDPLYTHTHTHSNQQDNVIVSCNVSDPTCLRRYELRRPQTHRDHLHVCTHARKG